MSSRIKKYLLLLIISCLSVSIYFLFFYQHWGILINGDNIWKFSIQSKETTTIENIRWIEPKSMKKIIIPKHNKPFNLIFQTSFTLTDFTRLKEGIIEYNEKYTVK